MQLELSDCPQMFNLYSVCNIQDFHNDYHTYYGNDGWIYQVTDEPIVNLYLLLIGANCQSSFQLFYTNMDNNPYF